MTKIEITIEGLEINFIYIEKDRDYINNDIILFILQKKDIKKEEVEFIRYLSPQYDAWMLLDENEKLKLDKEKGLKLLIKVNRYIESERQAVKKKEIMDKIKNINEKVNDEISKLKKSNKKRKNKDVQPSTSFYFPKNSSSLFLSETAENENSINNENLNSDVDIIVLTSNPLIDKNEGKELRTMNDFNSIAYSIYKVILDCNKQIYIQFLPLTQNNLEMAICKRPKILHLICKSVYKMDNDDELINENKINDKNNNQNKVKSYLLFENEKCEMKKIGEDNLNKIFNDLFKKEKDNDILKNISLFISTPLAEDIYEMIEKYSFKNLIIQHTTLANVSYIAELNEQLYKNIIELDKSLINALEGAKKDSHNILHQFCCCYHKHKDDCVIKQNLFNELYFEKEENNKSDLYKIPHFCHLMYKCSCIQNDFCKHNKKGCDNYLYGFKYQYKKIKKQNLCCCESLKKHHTLDNVFFTKFSDKEIDDGIFSNYQSNNFYTIVNSEFVPNYDKMTLIVGRNEIIYNIFDLLFDEKSKIINIYGKQYVESINIIDTFIDIIIEFLKERIPYIF